MSRAMTMILLLLITASTGFAAGIRSVTFFSDGALVEVEAVAAKGLVEISLPSGMLEESLRIRPLGNTVIQHVDITSSRQGGKEARELDSLLEQKSRLNDRLQALETREDIFKAAAKTQSAKAPRKTKTNPDPMQSIRQGTEFAIAQLEAVYTTRRKTEQEIHRLDARIAMLKKGGQGEGVVARVAISPKNGRIRARYALEGQGWTPCYDLRLSNDGNALLTLYGQLPSTFAGYLLRASPAVLANNPAAPTFPVIAGSLARLAEYRLPVREVYFGKSMHSAFSFEVTNTSTDHLPAGEATLYRSGEYWGRFRFEGISSARSRKLSSGI